MSNDKTYYQKRNEFSEMHYLLPRGSYMFDIDMLITSNDKSASYIEYNKGSFDRDLKDKFNLDKFEPVAIFEYKYHYTKEVVKLLDLPIYTAIWSSFMTAKMLNIRFFVVIGTHGKAPYYFFEYDKAGRKIVKNGKTYLTLKYSPDTAQATITDFWKNQLNLLK